MRVIVTGSRDWGYPELVGRALYGYWTMCRAMDHPMILRHGGCTTGADAAAEEWYQSRPPGTEGLTRELFPADWSQGRIAGPIRTVQMFADQVDMVLAFWDGKSRGTGYAVKLATERNVPLLIRFSPSSMNAP